jgi:hypothetical protein
MVDYMRMFNRIDGKSFLWSDPCITTLADGEFLDSLTCR